ncbi:MAG: RNA pseudouridine synthase [Pseudomonadota bacterium]
MDRIESHVTVSATGGNAVDLLHDAAGLPKQRIKLAMQQGAVWLTRGRNTQRLRRAKRALRDGDELHLYYDPKILAEVPPEPILVEDVGDYTVWDKPPGLRSQGSKWGDHCTVVRWAERHLEPERTAFTVHRLDRAASGLIIVAHTKSMASSLSALFRSRKVEKRYLVTVAGDFSSQPDRLRVDEPLDGKQAISEFSFLTFSAGRNQSQIEARIATGRKHQIRRHLADRGFPVIGDRLYGRGEADGVDLQLTAFLLAFRCPVSGKKVEYRLDA